MFLATLGIFPGTGNKLVVAWAFPRDHMGVIGTVTCANNSHMALWAQATTNTWSVCFVSSPLHFAREGAMGSHMLAIKGRRPLSDKVVFV